MKMKLKTLTGILFGTQSEGKINLITVSILGLFHLYATVKDKFQICFLKNYILLSGLGSSSTTN